MEQDGHWDVHCARYAGMMMPAMEEFRWQMTAKMMATASKGSWMGYNAEAVFRRIQEEHRELETALFAWHLGCGSIDAAIAEAVDLGNTAMMMHSWLLAQKRRLGGVACGEDKKGPGNTDGAGGCTPEQD